MTDYIPKYFKWLEFDQHGQPGTGMTFMDREFVQKLDHLRENVGFPLIITSGYRSSEYNKKVSTTGERGPHTFGRAVDIAISGARAHALIGAAINIGFTGIGIKQIGPIAGRFIHLDTMEVGGPTAPRPWIWTY